MAYIRAADRVGTTVNGFYIEDVKRENKRTYAYIICPYCKCKKWVRMETVTNGKNLSCGCYNASHNLIKAKDITGKRFGRLKAVKPTDKRDKYNSSVIWECVCDCKKITYASESNLTKGAVKSCGCLWSETRANNGKAIGAMVRDNFCIENTNIKNLTSKIAKNNTSGVKGVTWDKSRQKWTAQIVFKGKRYYLGRYAKIEEAAEVRKIAEDKLFGNFLQWYAEELPERWGKINNKEL